MELGSMENIPWNSIELWIWTKVHGIPWNLTFCCLSSMELHGTIGVVQMLFKIPGNSGENSMEFFDQNKFQ